MSTLPPLSNLTSSLHLPLHLHPLLTTATDALLQHLLLPLSITLLFSIYICTTPLPLYIFYKTFQHIRTLKAENVALKNQLDEMQHERDGLRRAQTQVVEERERLEDLFQAFGEIFAEFKEAGFGEMVDGMAENIDAGEKMEKAASGGVSRKRKHSEAFPRPVEVVFEEEEMEGMRRLSDASRKWFEDHELDLELLRRE
ncbi:lysophospholipase 2 [Physcia stellaris]|nr:lysophospholipase 2 [Physcia stellaris]